MAANLIKDLNKSRFVLVSEIYAEVVKGNRKLPEDADQLRLALHRLFAHSDDIVKAVARVPEDKEIDRDAFVTEGLDQTGRPADTDNTPQDDLDWTKDEKLPEGMPKAASDAWKAGFTFRDINMYRQIDEIALSDTTVEQVKLSQLKTVQLAIIFLVHSGFVLRGTQELADFLQRNLDDVDDHVTRIKGALKAQELRTLRQAVLQALLDFIIDRKHGPANIKHQRAEALDAIRKYVDLNVLADY